MKPIPQASPVAGFNERRAEYLAAVTRVLDSGTYVLGREVDAFEETFARYLGVGHCVGVANGTDALELALRACGIGPGDGVITVSHTAVATVTAIARTGATPVFVDIEDGRMTLDPAALQATLAAPPPGPRLRAVVPVHLYGAPADIHAIMSIAARHGLVVVEDCAQSHGAAVDGKKTGTFGHAAAFSFYPTKNLAAMGDGGCVVTDDPKIADAVRTLRQYGWDGDRVSQRLGVNSRLDELQAAILSVSLEYLEPDIERRRGIAAAYGSGLGGSPIRLPDAGEGIRHVFHQYVIRLDRRDDMRRRCQSAGVVTNIHYPVPVHLQPAFVDTVPGSASLPVTERAAQEIVSLPIFPQLTSDDVDRVIDVVSSAVS